MTAWRQNYVISIWRFFLFFWIICLLSFSKGAFAQENDTVEIYSPDKASLVKQQLILLHNREVRAETELKYLQQQMAISLPSVISKKMVAQFALDVAAAQSSLDSINIELTESRQTIDQFDKELQALENRLNVVNMFGLKMTRTNPTDLERLYEDRQEYKNLLALEKNRTQQLLKLQANANAALQLYQENNARFQASYQKQALSELKNRQDQTELDFQTKQNNWLHRLDALENQLTLLRQSGKSDETQLEQLRSDIFYAKEQIDFMYFQMLLMRYKDQIQQLDISINSSVQISDLNNLAVRNQTLVKQLDSLKDLLINRQNILEKNKNFYKKNNNYDELDNLNSQYQTAMMEINQLKIKLTNFRRVLDKAVQQEISSRQGLPGFNLQAWVNLGGEGLLIPHLTFQVFRSLSHAIRIAVMNLDIWQFGLIVFFEIFWIGFAIFLRNFLKKQSAMIPDHAAGHISLRWLMVKLIQRLLFDFIIFGNICWLLMLCNVPIQNYLILIDLAFVWLIFRAILLIARICLVETLQHHTGYDVKLYYHLKWVFLVGGIITAFTVFIHQLPIGYSVKDLFDRLFMFFLFFISVLLFRQWKQLPNLLLSYIDEKRTYLIRLIRMLAVMIPLVILINSLVGLFGYVNLVLSVFWYECIFIFVLAGYLLLRGFLNDIMDFISKLLIRYVTNGWLWMEAFLKPLSRMLQIALFLLFWAVLFLLYGWDQQSSVVERLNALFHYPLAHILSTIIMPVNIIEIAVIIYLLCWAARWTREFVYRLLLSRTKDLGLRNSIAILSQYAMIVCGILISLNLLGIDFKGLAFVATALAFGVGLGLRDLVNNFACGFLLLLERPLRIGDTVSLGDYEGEVTQIGTRAITVRTWDHIDVVIPNTEIFTKSFSNWTGKDAIVRTVIPIQIDRHDHPERVQKIILDVLSKHKDVLSDPMPEVFAKEMSDGLMGFEVRYFLNLRLVKSRPRLRSEVLVEIWNAFLQHGLRAPYPHRQILMEQVENNPKIL